jgi:Fur family transcriptional regulator, ferric uptake regulator
MWAHATYDGPVKVQHTHTHAKPAVTTDDLASALRSRGLRVTAQREQVLSAVRRLGHATPDDISESVSDVDVATVYRTLELFEELGLVRHAHLGHGAPSYRPAEDQHSHVVCHRCGKVSDADPEVVDELERRLHDGSGFELDRSHLTLFGTCRGCAGSDSTDTGTDERQEAMNQKR